MQARYSKETKNCTQEKRRGLKLKYLLCVIFERVILCTYGSGILFPIPCIIFVLQVISVFICVICVVLSFLNRTKCYYM